MAMPCFGCGNDEKTPNVVDEVWFDFGEANMRFCSSKTLYQGEDPPRACDACKKEKANVLANVVLTDAYQRGATGPLLPTRWWVRYTDGHVIGGDVARKS